MKKEIILSIVVLLIVILLEVFTTIITDRKMAEMNEKLEVLKSSLLDKNTDNISDEENIKKAKELKEKWEENEKLLCYYIEHDELDKVRNKNK